MIAGVASLGLGYEVRLSFEVGACQVIKQDRVAQVEEALLPLRQCRFNGSAVGMEAIEIPIERIMGQTRGIKAQDLGHGRGSDPVGHGVFGRGMDETIERHRARELD